MRVTAASAVVVASLGFLMAGCGASERQQVRSKVEQFAVAVADGDAKTICTQVFAPSLVRRFTSAGLTCERGLGIFFSGVQHPTLAVGSVTVHGSTASAVTLSGAGGQTASLRPVDLVKTTNGWRIVAVGAPVRSASASKTPTTSSTPTKTAKSSKKTKP